MIFISYRTFRATAILLALLFIPGFLDAHPGSVEFHGDTRAHAYQYYLKLGFLHILPLGLDHILFILSLFLLTPKLKTIVWQASAFTLAHSITLGLAASGYIVSLPHIVEPLIALSIMFVALENLISEELKASRIILIFAFGLIHGLGFAGVLSETGMPREYFIGSLIFFNVGVELGQLSVILIAWFAFARWHNQKQWYRTRFVYPVSVLIALVAFYWTIDRVFFT